MFSHFERILNMLKSMTGFGRAEELADGFLIKVQIKSVNHRYSDFTLKIPRVYNFIEEKVRKKLLEYISRGKVEVGITVEQKEGDDRVVSLNKELAKSYIDGLKSLSEFGIKDDVSISCLSGFSDIFSVEYKDIDEDDAYSKIDKALTAALEEFVAARCAEGESLKKDIESRLCTILEIVGRIEKRSPETVKLYRARLEEKMKELLGDAKADETRIITETAIFADKIAVDEETVRLRSHIKSFGEMLNTDKPIGKKLDFMIQEMNREANTIGSKATDVDICSDVVEIKSEIEKIREQIQNIE